MNSQLENARSPRRRVGYAVGAGVLTVGLLGGTVAAAASAGAAAAAPTVTGTCSSGGTKVFMTAQNSDPGLLEASFEVDHAQAGSVWNVTLRHDGVVYYKHARTAAGDGSFSVDRVLTNLAGIDRFSGRAVNTATGAICTVSTQL